MAEDIVRICGEGVRDGRGYCAEGLWGNGRKAEERCGSVEERCGSVEERCGMAEERCGKAEERCGKAEERCGKAEGN